MKTEREKALRGKRFPSFSEKSEGADRRGQRCGNNLLLEHGDDEKMVRQGVML